MSKSRRVFIRGEWSPGYSAQNAGSVRHVEIVSLIVSTWPEHLDAVSASILALGNTEIRGRDPKGKLIVVLEEPSQGAIGAKTHEISGLPHVLSATPARLGLGWCLPNRQRLTQSPLSAERS